MIDPGAGSGAPALNAALNAAAAGDLILLKAGGLSTVAVHDGTFAGGDQGDGAPSSVGRAAGAARHRRPARARRPALRTVHAA
ncbi:MAG TPA: hypothetical protein VFY71_17950 [Planctomycetota bacterium]|nr:hypothetical protein [Planctomycetota bacterium]